MPLNLAKFIDRFVGEARDHLGTLAAGIETLREAPERTETVDALFRAAHTIKGSARMLKLGAIAETAHHLEDVLSALRDGRVQLDANTADLLARAVDALELRVDALERDGADTGERDEALFRALAAVAAGAGATDASAGEAAAHGPQPGGDSEAAAAAPGADAGAGGATARGERSESALPAAAEAPTAGPEAPAARSESQLQAAEQVRIPVQRLDELIELLGEMVSSLAELRRLSGEAAALERHAAGLVEAVPARGGRAGHGSDDGAETRARVAGEARTLARGLRRDLQARELLTSTLSERTLALRMLPLATVFDPAVRMVRALAGELGKDVRCETHGGEIALDRQIITKLADCLGHCLRNAVDHGIEYAAGRHAAGKPERSRIQLTARHASGGVLIELSDDGRGLDRARILAKAEREGLIDAADAEHLTDEQAFELLFQPGFSTSEIITDLSGRGVGLDVVKHIVVDELNGAVSVNSRPGEGTRFLFKLPLSLAVMRVLVLGSGGRRVALPAQHVEESLRLRPEETITIAERPALVVRNELIPLVTLNEVLDPEQPGAGAAPPAARMVVIIGVRRLKLGLLVDTLVDERDMVVKSLPPHLQRCHLVGGVVSTGERALVCVLQAQTLIERARRVRVQGTATAAARPAAEQPHVLVADDSLNTREIEKELLEAHGYRVTIARDGLDAWHKAQAQPFDAVLSDVEMPRLDGFALTERLRAQDGYEATPIVLVTSRQKEEDKRRGAEVGADAYIVKGDFDQTSLLETLDNLLGRPPS